MKIFLKTAVLLAGALTLSATAQADETLELNKTQILRLDQPAAAIIIGNPKIADISVQSDKTLFMVGRGYGETNILILDSYDNVLLDTVVTVVPPRNRKQVNLILGSQGTQSYHCAPYCQPAPQLGNIAGFIAGGTAQGGGANGEAGLSDSGESDAAGEAPLAPDTAAPAGSGGDAGSAR